MKKKAMKKGKNKRKTNTNEPNQIGIYRGSTTPPPFPGATGATGTTGVTGRAGAVLTGICGIFGIFAGG